MKERPILFSAPMVQAILDGRKTQTRRIVKDVTKLQVRLLKHVHGDWPIGHTMRAEAGLHFAHLNQHGAVSVMTEGGLLGVKPDEFTWEHHGPGDLLWVKEVWTGTWHGVAVHLHYAADGSERMAGEAPTEYVLPKAAAKVGKWVTPLFMPRWASRITLEIASVRVQRLQGISEEDAGAEGCESWTQTAQDVADAQIVDISPQEKELARLLGPGTMPAKAEFRMLWESIHGAGSWQANPWVWALTFKRAPR